MNRRRLYRVATVVVCLLLSGSIILVTQSGNYREQSIRKGPWKLIPGAPRTVKKAARSVELYRLDTDLAETTNLAAQHPEKVRELTALLEQTRTSGRSRPSGTSAPRGGNR